MFQVYVTFPPQKRQRKSTVHVYVVSAASGDAAIELVRERVEDTYHKTTYGKPTSFEAFGPDTIYHTRTFLR